MPRSPREDYEGAWHHVMNRGIDHAAIFEDDADRRAFLIELRDACLPAQIQVHAYCLMANHYHLLLFTPAASLSLAMRNMSSKFTQATNRRYRRDGPLFRGRFRSVVVEDDAQLMQASRYIHRNPVEAGLVERADQWEWSSAGAYVGSRTAPDWLTTTTILTMQGRPDPHAAYYSFLD